MDDDALEPADMPYEDEQRSCSFVLRLWTEESATGQTGKSWRGQITHVASRKKAPVRKLADIGRFIVPYLEALGVNVGWPCKAKRWLRL